MSSVLPRRPSAMNSTGKRLLHGGKEYFVDIGDFTIWQSDFKEKPFSTQLVRKLSLASLSSKSNAGKNKSHDQMRRSEQKEFLMTKAQILQRFLKKFQDYENQATQFVDYVIKHINVCPPELIVLVEPLRQATHDSAEVIAFYKDIFSGIESLLNIYAVRKLEYLRASVMDGLRQYMQSIESAIQAKSLALSQLLMEAKSASQSFAESMEAGESNSSKSFYNMVHRKSSNALLEADGDSDSTKYEVRFT